MSKECNDLQFQMDELDKKFALADKAVNSLRRQMVTNEDRQTKLMQDLGSGPSEIKAVAKATERTNKYIF